MFSTISDAEIPGYSMITEGHEQGWEFVQCKIFEPWFHVECQIHEAENNFTRVFFIRYVDHIIRIVREPSMTIKEISLVSPAYINKQDGWKMEKLKEIWVGYEPGLDNEQEANIFVLQNENRYVYSALSTSEKKLLKKVQIFSV